MWLKGLVVWLCIQHCARGDPVAAEELDLEKLVLVLGKHSSLVVAEFPLYNAPPPIFALLC
jgi:hypothetical protein